MEYLEHFLAACLMDVLRKTMHILVFRPLFPLNFCAPTFQFSRITFVFFFYKFRSLCALRIMNVLNKGDREVIAAALGHKLV